MSRAFPEPGEPSVHLYLLNLCVSWERFAFSGGNNVTLRGSTDPKWGWVDGHGQAVSYYPKRFCRLSIFCQWWDAVQQVNRPHGWAFSKITNGVIRCGLTLPYFFYVSDCYNKGHEVMETNRLELCYKRLCKFARL